MMIGSLSAPFFKALPQNSFARTPLRYYQPTATEPATGLIDPAVTTNQNVTDGIWPKEFQSGEVSPCVRIKPYCEGPPGTLFWMRLWGWDRCSADEQNVMWLPTLLVQLACWSGALSGVPSSDPEHVPSPYPVSNRENFCAAVAVVSGSLGYGGSIRGNGTGSGVIVKCEIAGCSRLQFEFQQGEFDHVGMNALWSKAS